MINSNTNSIFSIKVFSLLLLVLTFFLSSCSIPTHLSSNKNKRTAQAILIPPVSPSPVILVKDKTLKTLKKAEIINNTVGFLSQVEVDRIKKYAILGSNYFLNQSIFNVVFFLPAKEARNKAQASEKVTKNLREIYRNELSKSDLVLDSQKTIDATNKQIIKIRGVDCLGSLKQKTCKLELVVTYADLLPNPKFVFRKGASYLVKVRAKLYLPKGQIDGKKFYQGLSSQLPNWTFSLVDYETKQVVHIQRGYLQYFF